MSRRRLHPDEVALWQRVAETAEPLNPGRDAPVEQQSKARNGTKPKPRATSDPVSLPDGFEIGRNALSGGARHDLLSGITERVAAAPLQMDQKAHARLKRGKLKPEARIDLHGMTLDQARPALIGFILESHARERRLVLVITGKGKHRDDLGPIPMRPGALRHHVPMWLKAAPASQAVLQVVQAHARHGGEGAYYVYLRRRR